MQGLHETVRMGDKNRKVVITHPLFVLDRVLRDYIPYRSFSVVFIYPINVNGQT